MSREARIVAGLLAVSTAIAVFQDPDVEKHELTGCGVGIAPVSLDSVNPKFTLFAQYRMSTNVDIQGNTHLVMTVIFVPPKDAGSSMGDYTGEDAASLVELSTGHANTATFDYVVNTGKLELSLDSDGDTLPALKFPDHYKAGTYDPIAMPRLPWIEAVKPRLGTKKRVRICVEFNGIRSAFTLQDT